MTDMTNNSLTETTQPVNTHEVFVTQSMHDAFNMTITTQQHRYNHVGLVLGHPGTGKTIASHWLHSQIPNSHRICCYAGMSKKQFVQALATASGCLLHNAGRDALIAWLYQNSADTIYIIDEANHLGWQHMESIRFLADEAKATVILIGTELLNQTLQDRRTATYLAQLNSRIGGKTVVFKPFSDDEMGLVQIRTYFLAPRFGLSKPKQSVAKAFLKACKGNWRLGNELADTCERLMKSQEFAELTTDVINAAAVHLANHMN